MADYAFRTLEDRQKIEKLWEDGRTPKEISETTGVSVHVVYNELTRGQDGTRLPDQRLRYSAELARLPRRSSDACTRRWAAGKAGRTARRHEHSGGQRHRQQIGGRHGETKGN